MAQRTKLRTGPRNVAGAVSCRSYRSCYDGRVKRFVVVMLLACNAPEHREQVSPHPAPIIHRPDAVALDAATPDATDDAALAIVDAPMAWSAEREQLTLDYRRKHSDPNAKDLTIAPTVIVLHYTSGNSAKATRAYFDNTQIEPERTTLRRAGHVNVSAHYVVDRDGTIYRLQPETQFARHCIGLNHIAIGIENVGDEAEHPLTDAQIAADAALVRDLAARFPITHLFGHYEVMKLHASPLYVELDPTYKNDKPDPGARFMAAVRERVADLHLEGL
jgi:N-acetylmuramoyl-L-alanine amidase